MTRDEETKIRLLSEGTLYQMAEEFVSQHGSFADDEQGRKQVNGILKYGREGLAKLDEYAKKQAARNWSGQKQHYRPLYQALQRKLSEIVRLTKEQGFVAENLPDNKVRMTEPASLLTQEFIQHLAAEMLYRHGGE
jgi:hypothetical protein